MRARTSPSTASIFSASAAFSGSMGARTGESDGRLRNPRGGRVSACADARACDGGRRGAVDAKSGRRGSVVALPRGPPPGPRLGAGAAVAAGAAAKRLADARDVLGVPLARPRALAGTREDVSTDRRLRAASGGGASARVPPSDASSNSSPSARNSGFPNGTPTVPVGSCSTASGSAVQYTRMAPFSSKPNRVYPPTMRSDLARLSYTSSNSSASTASRGSSFSTCASLNTSARHSRIGTELASAWRASTVGVRHTSSLPERPRSNTAPVIFRPTTQTPPDDRRSPRDRRTRPDRDPAGTGRAPQLALAGRAPSVPQRPTAPNLARHFGPARAVPTVNVREAVGV